MLAGVNEDFPEPGSQHSAHRRCLNELRPGSDNGNDFHRKVSILAFVRDGDELVLSTASVGDGVTCG